MSTTATDDARGEADALQPADPAVTPAAERAPSPVPTEGPVGAPRRGMATLPDMLKALGAALVLTGVFAAVQLREPAPDAPATVQIADVAAQAAPAAAYPVLLPVTVPAGWSATASRIEPARSGSVTVNLGLTTADGAYVGVEQSDGEPRPYLAADILDGQAAGTWRAPAGSATAGTVWTRRTAETSGDRALVLQPRADVAAKPGAPEAWVVVYGTAPWGDLERVAAALQPRR